MAITDSNAPSQTEVSKHVTIRVYGQQTETDFDPDAREVIAGLLTQYVDFDPLAFEEKTKHSAGVQINAEIQWGSDNQFSDELDRQVTAGIYSEEFAEQVLAEFDGELPEWLETFEKTETERDYDHSYKKAVRAVIQDVLDDDELTDLGYTEQDSYGNVFEFAKQVEAVHADADGDDEASVTVSAPYSRNVEPRKVLTHQSERDPDNRYESDDERWSFDITVEVTTFDEQEVDEISERVVLPVYRKFAGLDTVSAVRLLDCEVTETKKGDCYNL